MSPSLPLILARGYIANTFNPATTNYESQVSEMAEDANTSESQALRRTKRTIIVPERAQQEGKFFRAYLRIFTPNLFF